MGEMSEGETSEVQASRGGNVRRPYARPTDRVAWQMHCTVNDCEGLGLYDCKVTDELSTVQSAEGNT